MNNVHSRDGFYCELLLCLLISYNKFTLSNIGFLLTVDDVMEELGVKRSKAYSILKQLNDELEKEGDVAVRGKIPRPYWETKFYGCSQRAV